VGEIDLYLFAEGNHYNLHDQLGAHLRSYEGVDGVHFAVWAPNAKRVSVVGSFNEWDGRVHVMRSHGSSGVWDIFIPDLGSGTLYKFELLNAVGEKLPLKHDPYGHYFEQPPGNAAIVFKSEFNWTDSEHIKARKQANPLQQPISTVTVNR